MADTHIVFQTIKLGDRGKIVDDPPKDYFSLAEYYDGILLANVKPFCIVGGHVTINLFHDASLIALRLTGNKRSLPILIDFDWSTPGFQDRAVREHQTLRYVTLSRKMKGYYWRGNEDRMERIVHELADVTHLYLLLRDYRRILESHHTVSMTLLLKKDTKDPGITVEKGDIPLENRRRKPNR